MPSRIKRSEYIRFMKSWTEEYTIKNVVSSVVRGFHLSGRWCSHLCILRGNSLYDSDVRTDGKIPNA